MDEAQRGGSRKAPFSLRLHGFLRLFVKIRFGAAAAAIAVVAVSQNVLRIDFPYAFLYGIGAAVLAYNVGFALFLARKRPEQPRLLADEETDLRANRLVALLQINLDFVALTALLHFSGGLENPFVLFFLFHVVIAGLLLDAPLAAAEAGLAALLIFGLGALEKTGALLHYHPEAVLGSFELATSWMFVLGLSALMAVTIAALSAFTIALMAQRTHQRNQLIALSHDLRAKNDRLQEIDASRRKLLAVATHDLKAPIGAVMSYLQAMRDGYVDPVTPKQVEIIEKSLRRLERLRDFIGDVLSLQSIQHGELQRVMRPVDLVAVLKDVARNHEDAAAAKSIALSLDAAGDVPEIEGAPERLAQVFDNLVANAVKYTGGGGRVEIRARMDGGRVLVEVADDGIGISEADLARVFEDFFRSSAVRASHEGTGLGLALSQRIVAAHHGEIWATSEVGKGTTFRVRLPIVQPLHSALPEERDSKILIAEVLDSLGK